jgi:hypothetical protein
VRNRSATGAIRVNRPGDVQHDVANQRSRRYRGRPSPEQTCRAARRVTASVSTHTAPAALPDPPPVPPGHPPNLKEAAVIRRKRRIDHGERQVR